MLRVSEINYRSQLTSNTINTAINTVTNDGNTQFRGSLIPLTNATHSIGTSNLHFKEAWIDTVHISQNTLYLGETPVLGTESDSIAIKADTDQSINVKTTGLGTTNLTSTKGVNVSVSGLNSVIDVQSSGVGGRVVLGATTEVALNAPVTTIGSNLTVQGNLVVNGTQFTANVQTVDVRDNIIVLNKGQVGSGVSAGLAGISIDRGDAAAYQLLFNESTDKFEIGPVGALASIATEAYALPKTGGTLTGDLNINGSLYAAGNVIAASNIVGFSTTTSDSNLKWKFEPIADALTKLQNIGAYTFQYRNDERGCRHAGVIAQDVQKVLPEVVSQHPVDGSLTVAYGNMTTLLIAGFRELATELRDVKERVSTLEAEVASLRG